MMDIWALIPVKSLLDSKRRLSHLLTAGERAQLITDLLQRELGILNASPAIDKVLVVSSDPAVWDLARQYGALVEEEAASCGLNIAVARGLRIAARNGAAAVLILPVDLPFITAADLDLIVKSPSHGMIWDQRQTTAPDAPSGNGYSFNNGFDATMVICSDEDGCGTNALFINPAQEFTFHFGPDSFQSHLQEAQKRGLAVRVVSAFGLEFDLDSEQDWFTYQASTVGC